MKLAIPLAVLLAAATSRPGCDGDRTAAVYHPCAEKRCGEGCHLCAPGDPDCVESQEVKVCNAGGQCVSEIFAICDGVPVAPHPDCVGKACGADCNPCGPSAMCPTLIASACDRFGQCQGAVPWLCYDPCAGKACGDPCQACPWDAKDCFETMVVKACDPAGRCLPAGEIAACR